LERVFEAAFGNSKGRGAPAAGISGTIFTPSGTIPEAFCGVWSFAVSDWLLDTGGELSAFCALVTGEHAQISAISTNREIQSDPTRFIMTPKFDLCIKVVSRKLLRR
jgi:hypothetical protein